MQDTVERTLYYYEVRFKLFKDAEKQKRTYLEIINKIKSYIDVNSQVRFIKKRDTDENKFGVFDYHNFDKETNKIGFKLIRMRKDVFPQIMDDDEASLEDLTNTDNKSIVESTHVLLDYNDDKVLKVAIEFNFEGPRINDFIIYLKKIGSDLNLTRSLFTTILANNKLEEVANKIGMCKFLNIKVLKENINEVKKHDSELGSVLDSLSKFSKSNYYSLKLRLDYEKNNQSNKNKILTFIKTFTNNKNALDYYDGFSIEAEDTSKPDNSFETFDLLMDKIKSKVTPTRKHTSKVIISNLMYNLMLEEYKNKIA
jgi:hypothetical protein